MRQRATERGVADYALEVEGETVLVVEAKQRLVGTAAGWAATPAAQQLRRYMVATGCPGLLVDAHEVHLFDESSDSPQLSFSRVEMTSADLRMLGGRLRQLLPRQARAVRPQPEGHEDMLHTLATAGLVCPPLGQTEPGDVDVQGAWTWSSSPVAPITMYMFEVGVVERMLDKGHFFALSHAGHGINSYGLNLVTGRGPVAAFVQHGYGGGYMENTERASRINETYGRVRAALEKVEGPGEPRWLLLYSEFRGVCALVDLELRRAGGEGAVVRFDSEEALFVALQEKLSCSPSGTDEDEGDVDA